MKISKHRSLMAFVAALAMLTFAARFVGQDAPPRPAATVTLSPSSLAFGVQTVGTISLAQVATLTNNGTQTATITSIAVTGDFDQPAKTCGSKLAAGASCTITLSFMPTAIGARTGQLTVNVRGQNAAIAGLSGTGTNVALNPSSINFGDVGIGVASAALPVNLTNVGSTALVISSTTITGTNASNFVISANSCGSAVGAGQTCAISITFTPTTLSVFAATLMIADNGGGSPQSVPLSGTGSNPIPAISTITPFTVIQGGPAFTLTVTGAGFESTSAVQVNNSNRATTFVSSTELTAKILATDISMCCSAIITVVNPAPGGGSSNEVFLQITPTGGAPFVNSLTPPSTVAGGKAFLLSVFGSNFISKSVVRWNGSNRRTTFVNSSNLTAQIPASDIANAGMAGVTVFNPGNGGGLSDAVSFSITFPATTTLVSTNVNDIVWDPYNQVIYASLPSADGSDGNTISVIDPFTGAIINSVFAGSEPTQLAISDDSEFLYVGLNGSNSIQRFVLPALTPDITISLDSATLGPLVALFMHVLPGEPHSLALIQASNNFGFPQVQGVVIYDDAVQRTNGVGVGGFPFINTVTFGSSASTLYGYDGSTFYIMAVTSSGLSISQQVSNLIAGSGNIHFDNGLIYSDSGDVIDPVKLVKLGIFGASGPMLPDSTVGRSFFLASAFNGPITLEGFDLSHFTPLGNVNLASLGTFTFTSGFLRWGQNGLAFVFPAFFNNSAAGPVALITSPLVLPISTTNNPVPAITTISPASVKAGSANFQLTVNGSNFVLGSLVNVNGNARTTNFVSGTQLIAFIPASDLVTAGSAQIMVFNPTPGGGTSNVVDLTIR